MKFSSVILSVRLALVLWKGRELSNPEWLIVINETDLVNGEEMADVQ